MNVSKAAADLQVFFDGSFGPEQGKPGTAAYGFVIKTHDHTPVYAGYGRVGTGIEFSSNVGEYAAITKAMEWIIENRPNATVTFYGDSQLVIEQMNGRAKAKQGKYLRYYHEAMSLAMPYIMAGLWAFEWIPRSMNSEADNLAQYSRYPISNN